MKRSALVLVALLTACGGATTATAAPSTTEPTAPAGEVITGTFTLLQDEDVVRQVNFGQEAMSQCAGTGGYDDIETGAQVVVRDGEANVIGTGHLGHDMEYSSVLLRDLQVCVFTFTVAVPTTDFYSVEVGRRGDLTYSHADMEANGWVVEASLGER